LPNSGYASGGTHLLVDRSGRAVTNFVVEAPCASSRPLPRLPIRRDKTFRFAGAAPGKRAARVTISGRFVSATAADVQVRVVAPGCNSGPGALTLRLS
jgi:hypothetical protein